MISRNKMQECVGNATGCNAQHDGWTCGSCFFAVSEELNNQDWQNLLLLRGDYKENELNNLPQDRNKSMNKIYHIMKTQ